MNKLKIWNKPTIEVAHVRLAKAGGFSTNDAKMTHRS